jgi:cobalt-zinc-cadmium efflux system protein
MTASNSVLKGRSRRMALVLCLNSALVIAEVSGGIVSHSTALVADAGHNVADSIGFMLVLVALRYSLRSPTVEHSFGYHRSTILAALANVAIVLAVAMLIATEAIYRLFHPVAVHGALVAIIGGCALVVNAISARIVYEKSRELSSRSALIHVLGDALSSLGVLIGGLIIFATGRFFLLDPILSLAISGIVATMGIRLVKQCVNILSESVPSDVDLASVAQSIADVEGVSEVHDMHCWSLSSEVRALSAHVVLSGHPTLEQAQDLAERIKIVVGPRYGIAHSTLELECERCVDEDSATCAIDTFGVP